MEYDLLFFCKIYHLVVYNIKTYKCAAIKPQQILSILKICWGLWQHISKFVGVYRSTYLNLLWFMAARI